MGELSRFRTIVDSRVQREGEFRLALRNLMGNAIEAPHVDVLGWGANHAFRGTSTLASTVMREIWPDIWNAFELASLAAQLVPEPERQAAKDGWISHAREHIENMQNLDHAFRTAGASKEERDQMRRVAEAQALLQMAIPILSESGVEPGAIPGADVWLQLEADLPMTHIVVRITNLLYDNPDLPREPSNFADLLALAQGLTCCDVVVTEKQWVDLVGRDDLDKRYGVTMLADVRDVPPLIAPQST